MVYKLWCFRSWQRFGGWYECFWVKGTIKKAVLWEDFSYRKVLGIQEYLIEKFRDDPCKKYFLVDLTKINNHRSKTSMKINCANNY